MPQNHHVPWAKDVDVSSLEVSVDSNVGATPCFAMFFSIRVAWFQILPMLT